MRYRATAAVVVGSGTLVLTAAVLPTALADGPARPAAAASGRTTPAFSTVDTMDVAFSKVSVDKGAAAVAVGTTNIVHVPYTYTLTATGVDPTKSGFSGNLDLYRGTAAHPGNDLSGNHATCKLASKGTGTGGATVWTETCAGAVDVYPHDLTTADAGAGWLAVAYAYDSASQGWAQQGGLTAPTLQRYARLTVNASPEPVVKGRTVTITGVLTRANWDTHKYAGYTVRPLVLQFRAKTSSSYTSLQTVTTDSHGDVKTTSKATVDGYWRYTFAGTSTTPAVTSSSDYVDVS